jgi:beta-phosphoglucomutase
MRIRACIFDLDGVLTDTAAYHFQAWQRLAHSLGIDFDEQDNDQLKGVGRMDSLKYIVSKGPKKYGHNELEAMANQKNEDYKRLIATISPKDLLSGAHQAFDWLKRWGWKIGLASASRNAPQVIKGLRIESFFDYVADAGSIPNGKPAPDIFLDVAKGLNVPPEDCVGVEDAAAGVTAIKSAGMPAIGIGRPEQLSHADFVQASLIDIELVFQKLGRG